METKEKITSEIESLFKGCGREYGYDCRACDWGDCNGSCSGICGQDSLHYQRKKFFCVWCHTKLTELEDKLEAVRKNNKK